VDWDVDLTANYNIWVPEVLVCKQIECHDHGAIGAVFKRDHAKGRVATLHCGEDIVDVDTW